MKKSNTVQYHGVGRRKKSVARVFLRPGTGNIVVNGKTWKNTFHWKLYVWLLNHH